MNKISDASKSNGLITFRQMNILIVFTMIAPLVRIVSNQSTSLANQASWVSVLLTLPIFYIFVILINFLFKKNSDKSLSDIICMILGNKLGKILLLIYVFLTFFYFCFNARILRRKICIINICIFSSRNIYRNISRNYINCDKRQIRTLC